MSSVFKKNEKTLIYALTADTSESALNEIKKGRFDKVLGYLDFNAIQSILAEIKHNEKKPFRPSN